LSITPKGLKALFGGTKIGIVLLSACEAAGIGSGFPKAGTFLSYNGDCAIGDSIFDALTLFDGLAGGKGIDHRNSVTADRGGLVLGPDAKPIVLAPAVRKVMPKNGGSLPPGKTTQVQVQFDSRVRPAAADTVVNVTGCGKIVSGSGHWSDHDQQLSFDIKVPDKPEVTDATLTVIPSHALGAGTGIKLDGNKNGQSTDSGVYPNKDAYLWKLTCSAGIGIFLTGSADGFNLNGEIQATGSSVKCQNLGQSEVQAFVNGHLANNVQVGLEFEYRSPGGSIGPGTAAASPTSPGAGSVTLDLYPGKPPKLDHAAGGSSGQFGTGSGSISGTAKGGSLNLTLDDGVTVKGPFTCG
jgi:hypothetical protein